MATENIAYIDGETIVRIMAVCDCPQFRAILALCPFGGLRCPSEIANLETSDIDLQAGRIRIREHKTKERYLPIFPELRPHIFDNYDPNRKRFIWRFSPTNSNLRKPLLTLLEKAGIDPWPRFSHKLRASCQTDLINSRYPALQVRRWLWVIPKPSCRNIIWLKPTSYSIEFWTMGWASAWASGRVN